MLSLVHIEHCGSQDDKSTVPGPENIFLSSFLVHGLLAYCMQLAIVNQVLLTGQGRRKRGAAIFHNTHVCLERGLHIYNIMNMLQACYAP